MLFGYVFGRLVRFRFQIICKDEDGRQEFVEQVLFLSIYVVRFSTVHFLVPLNYQLN
jgi:hypothetical protein